MKRWIILILLIFNLPFAEAKCFSYRISDLQQSKLKHPAVVKLISDSIENKCLLQLAFKEVEFFGEAEGQLCKTAIGDKMKVKINTYCCDTSHCENQPRHRIWFTQ